MPGPFDSLRDHGIPFLIQIQLLSKHILCYCKVYSRNDDHNECKDTAAFHHGVSECDFGYKACLNIWNKAEDPAVNVKKTYNNQELPEALAVFDYKSKAVYYKNQCYDKAGECKRHQNTHPDDFSDCKIITLKLHYHFWECLAQLTEHIYPS